MAKTNKLVFTYGDVSMAVQTERLLLFSKRLQNDKNVERHKILLEVGNMEKDKK